MKKKRKKERKKRVKRKEKERRKRRKKKKVSEFSVRWEIKSEQEKKKKCGGAYVWSDRESHTLPNIYEKCLISQLS